MLHTRTEAIKNESLNDEAEEDKGNNDFSDFIVKKDSNNINKAFIKLFQRFKNLPSFFTTLSIDSKAFKGKISWILYF